MKSIAEMNASFYRLKYCSGSLARASVIILVNQLYHCHCLLGLSCLTLMSHRSSVIISLVCLLLILEYVVSALDCDIIFILFYRLSERNCVEIITKLVDMKLLDIIFTNDGKEYVTPKQLVTEMKDELYVHGGKKSTVLRVF